MEELAKKFLNDKMPAIIGISENDKKWGNELLRAFLKAGYSPVPVSKSRKIAEDIECLCSLSELPNHVRNLIIAIPKTDSEALIESIEEGRFYAVWFVYGSKSQEIIKKAESKGLKVIFGFCPMMFINSTGIHKFHYAIKKTFSRRLP